MLSIILPKSRNRATVVAGLLVLLALPAGPALPAEPRSPGPKDRCRVCGMFVESYRNWIATVLLEDGTRLFFDGPKDLFKFLHNPGKYGHDLAAMADVLVTGYYTTELISAKDAFFVVGSDVMGPMGHELVALRSRGEAEEFVRDHGGARILTFAEVTEGEVPK